MEKIKVDLPIIVEGKYDKITLSSAVDARIITLSGFSVFNSKEKQLLIRRLAEAGGIILLTDSDSGGKQIRSFLSGIVPSDKLYHVYIPQIKGKEKRKSAPSKQGLLGVEGMERELLLKLLSPFESGKGYKKSSRLSEREVTKTELFLDGLSGKENSSQRRARLLELCSLPADMSANAMLDAINMLYTYGEYKDLLSKI